MANFLGIAVILIIIGALIGTINAEKSWRSGVMWSRTEGKMEKLAQDSRLQISKTGGALLTGGFTALVVLACYLVFGN